MRHVLLGLMLLTGWCADDGTIVDPEPEPLNEPLNEEESRALLSGLNDMILTPDRLFRERGDTLLVDCPDSGQILMSGRDRVNSDGSFWLSVTLKPRDCAYTIDGHAFTLPKGSLDHKVTYGVGVNYTIVGRLAGTLDWLLADRFGDCEIEMMFTLGASAPLEGRYTGKACGFDAEFTVDLSRS